MALASMSEIFERMARNGQEFWEVVLADDMDERQVSREASMAKMLTTWQAMQDAADSYTGRKRSVSGLVGGDGMKMRQYTFRGCAMTGGYVSEVIAEALSMAESNACMRRIVAAPTAGACGVLPAVLLPLCKYEELTQHQLLEALYVAAGIGSIIAYKASIAGASGGCQAEIGTASAMAAGALVALRGGEGEQIGHAVAMALKNLMGLVCDPVAGLVEILLFLGGGERARERAGIAGKAQGEKQAVAQKPNGSGKHIHQLLPSPYVGAGSPYAYALRRRLFRARRSGRNPAAADT